MVTENTITSSGISPIPAPASQPSAVRPVRATLLPMDPADFPGWDAQVLSHARGTIFHGTAWARVLQSTYGYTPSYLMDGVSGAFRSLLPLMEVRSWLTGTRGVGLPFTDDSGPLCAGGTDFKELFWNAVELGRARNWKSVECRGGRDLWNEAPASLAFYGHRLDLETDEARQFARLDSSTRRAVRKAEKSGVKVDVSRSLEAMKIFYSLHCRTRKKHGMPTQPFVFFANIHRHLFSRNLGVVVTASHQNRPVAASVYFQLGDRAVYKFGASDESFQQFRGSNLVMWEAIQWHARNGARTLHLGRTSLDNDGLRRFKLGWGAAEDRIEYVKYDLRTNRFAVDKDEASGWHNRVFRRMPVGFSRLVGAALYRHWA